MTKPNFSKILDKIIEKQASDLHITTGRLPVMRVDNHLVDVKGCKPLTQKDVSDILSGIMTAGQKNTLDDNMEIDFAHKHGTKGRFRVNVYRQGGEYAAAFRLIPAKIKTFSELNLPSSLDQFTNLQQGLFLAVGPAGHGKSTTIASMLDYINHNRTDHIITIEDPIEYIFTQDKCLIGQREVHKDTLSFPRALRSALRQDPDIVFVGEMRDLETISTALTIAETGHMVYSTLHTNSAAETIDRLIDVFPPHQQNQVKAQLAATLRGIISQRLVPQIDGGRIPAWELLKSNSAVQNTIREGKSFQLHNIIQTSVEEGMMPLDQSLANLVQEKKVNAKDALFYAHDDKYLKKLIN